ncbi:MAG: bifunctional glutamate N-acetyltransferase/amino-acid acetyltransferase ArgJ [Gammaproteobacteria bacterium]
MAVGYEGLSELIPVKGIRLASVAAGIRYAHRDDLVLIEMTQGSVCSAVFTQNVFCAAPVTVCRKHLDESVPRYLLINSGNANAGTGEMGLQNAQLCCESLASELHCSASEILPFSTGVIGEHLPVDMICSAYHALFQNLNENHWSRAAHAIMTTDTLAKGISIAKNINGVDVTVTGIAKGSGMICPDMATLLSFIATDAKVSQTLLDSCLTQAVNQSFNRITVDGDTSTNDACVLMATGQSKAVITQEQGYAELVNLIVETCKKLAQLIIRDAEGATKFVTVSVEGGGTSSECLQVAYTVAHSPLVKTALFASDPNWGRILAAVGRSGLENFKIQPVEVYLDDVCIVREGGVADDYTEQQGQQVFDQTEFTVRILLGRGQAREEIWTSDLSHDYISINADYRS